MSQLFASRMAVGAGEAGLAPPAYSIITDSYCPAHFGYAMSFYKTGVRVGGGFAYVIGGFLIDRYTRLGAFELPLIGTVLPWQATLMTVGLPGVLLALLMLTMVEPKRKELAVSRSGRQRLPVGEFVKFIWQRKRVYLPLFIGSSMLAMAGYGSSAWYPEFLIRNYGLSPGVAGTSYGTITIVTGVLGIMVAPWIANRLAARGYKDAYVRTLLATTLIATLYVAHRRRQRGSSDTYGELSAKTKELIEENTTFVETAQSLPVLKIDRDYSGKLDELPTPADKAAALEAMLTAELAEGGPGFLYRQLGERLQKIKERQETDDEATAKRLRDLEAIAGEVADARLEPERLSLTAPGEYGLFTILRAYTSATDETYIAECARNMVGHLRQHRLLVTGWSNSVSGRMGVEQSLLAESWNPPYEGLGLDAEDPPFLRPAVEELAKSDGVSDG